jgi:predicted acylesterase/phospholipase RssA
MGTSAGALTGALYAAGHAPDALAAVLSERTPLSYLVRPARLRATFTSFLHSFASPHPLPHPRF